MEKGFDHLLQDKEEREKELRWNESKNYFRQRI